MSNTTKIFLLISLAISIYLNQKELFILGYAILLLICFYAVFGVLSNIINNRYSNFLSVGIANGIVMSWTFSTALPLYIP